MIPVAVSPGESSEAPEKLKITRRDPVKPNDYQTLEL